MSIVSKRVATLALFFVILTLPTITEGRQAKDAPAPPNEAPPVFVEMEISYGDNPPFSVSAKHGGFAAYVNLVHQYRVGIIPQVVNAASGEIDLWLVELDGKDQTPRAGKIRETLRGKVGFSSITSEGSSLPLEIKIVDLRLGGESVDGASVDSLLVTEALQEYDFDPTATTNLRNFDGDGCCITCGGEVMCGCCVGTSCGGCCGPNGC